MISLNTYSIKKKITPFCTKTVFGIVMFLNYIIYFFIFDFNVKHIEISLAMRLFASCLCLPLIFLNFDNLNFTPVKRFYWYFVVTYCLPFFFTFMTLINNLSTLWLMNSMSAAFLMLLILRTFEFFVSFLIGIISAFLIYISIFGEFAYDAHHTISLYDIIATYLAVIVIGIIFAYNKENIESEKQLLNQELEEKIAERTAELEKALAVRTEILNNVNHEIRTPLHGFSIIAKELANNWDDFSNEKRKLLASQVSSNVIRLEKLIYNLLDLSILSNGKTILHFEVTEFNNLISAMIEESKALYMSDKQIEIISLTDDKLTVNIDQEKINQVLRNLIINAIRFSPPQTKIIIKAEIIGNNLHFYIKDQGLGVPEEELETIFNVFTQSSRTKTGAGGTGLGLSICKKIIESHQGKIWAENNIDVGTAFHVVIPRNIEEEKKERKEKRDAIILMIDDEEICHMGMELLLKDSGYKLHKTSSGEEGKIIIEKEKIDLILLDIMMPEVNGIEFLKELRASGNEIPVIMQSGAVNAEEMLEGLEIAGLITKPYKKEKVIKIIDSVVGSMKDNLNNLI